MSWFTGSIRNKLIALFALGMAIVFAAALYGFGAARGGLEALGHVNDTLIAQAIRTQTIQASFKEQVQAWMAVLVRGHDAEASAGSGCRRSRRGTPRSPRSARSR